jgi:hypothetical protein
MDIWTSQYGPQLGTVIVYGVSSERQLLAAYNALEAGKTAIFREPDLNYQATAFATDQGPLDLPLLGKRARPESREVA